MVMAEFYGKLPGSHSVATPVFDATAALARLEHLQRRNAVAAVSHRKRVEAWIVDRDRR